MQCLACGLLITWPRPSPAALAALYASDVYYSARDMGVDSARAWESRAASILGLVATCPMSVLDFGAGMGHLVQALILRGIAAEGVEPSAAGRAAAAHLYGLDLRASLVPDMGGRFSLVTLIHVLEHVEDPVASLRDIAATLDPNGRIFIEVPHAGSVEMWRPGRRRDILDLPAHLYHFTPETLTRTVERAGLRVASVRLTNPDVLEWALAVRATWQNSSAKGRPGGQHTPSQPPQDGMRVRALWRRHLLPQLRRRFPGASFQVIASQ